LTGDFTVVYRDCVPFGMPTVFCRRAEYKSLFSVTVNSGFMPERVFARANNINKKLSSRALLRAGKDKCLAKRNFQEDADARLRNSKAVGSFSRFGELGFSTHFLGCFFNVGARISAGRCRRYTHLTYLPDNGFVSSRYRGRTNYRGKR
jgi:hypothetical protein